jgi:hypothetical protein
MQPTIETDHEVFEALKTKAEPFVDTPNSVLRRVLGLEPGDEPVASAEVPSKPARPAYGQILPEREYEIPILRYLNEQHEGRAPSRDVVQAVGEELRDDLTELDMERQKSGEIRWENRARWVRRRLVERGDLKEGSPRGTWEISEKGRERLRSNA